MTDDAETPKKSPLLVAIGTSAGGLAALQRFFSALPETPGACFVVVQHLSPHYPSHMSDLLARYTRMPVRQVNDGDVLEANNVLLIPPGKELTLHGETLRLAEREQATGTQPSQPIDLFFSSAAKRGARAAGVILTGTGSDGSRGLAELAAQGSGIFVQDPESAEFPGMPTSALRAVSPNLTGAPSELAVGIQSWLRGGRDSHPGLGDAHDSLLRLLYTQSGVDFSLYKQATILRRVERRMGLCGVTDLADYLSLVSGNAKEAESLVTDLLIGVTGFFRDEALFARLRTKLFPDALSSHARSGAAEFRVWVPACATGQEVYSLAMLLDEASHTVGFKGSLRIFATDVHRGALEKASLAVYPNEDLEPVPPDLSKRYTHRVSSTHFRIDSHLRNAVVFAPHNVLADPPFTKVDLLSCRNLLIYFDSAAQEVALATFRYALQRDGLLVLGASEGVANFGSDFRPVDSKLKLFRKVRGGSLPHLLGRPTHRKEGTASRNEPVGSPPPSPNTQLLADYDQILNQCDVRGLLLDDEGNALHVFGDAGSLLHFGDGRVGRATVELLPEVLRERASSLVQRARYTRQVSRSEPVEVKLAERRARLELIATPLVHRSGPAHVLLSFRERPWTSDHQGAEDDPEAAVQYQQYVEDLQLEVKATRENLQATIEELQTTIEELQSTNQELQSANEELQSSNEELQSVNEELHTVNSEYEEKNQVLTRLNRDLESLLDTTDAGIVFVDSEHCVRRFNRAAQAVFRLSERDIGRSLTDIVHDFGPGIELHKQLDQVLNDRRAKQFPAVGRSGNHFLVRLQPYEQDTERGDNALITVTDVTHLKGLEERVQHGRRLASIGRLAGGIAHDFNNILAGIHGNAELLLHREDEEQNREDIQAILTASRRAASLTANLLSFGRKARLDKKPLDVHELIGNVLGLARAKLDPRVQVELELTADCAVVEADEAQIQAVLLNLLLNANDAMPHGGKVTIATKTQHDTGDGGGLVEQHPVEYLFVSVSDEGEGIGPDAQDHVFEPYFSTKGELGNGLGLAAAHGTVEEHGGLIDFQSTSLGTTFWLYLPLRRELTVPDSAPSLAIEATTQRARRVLVAEDERILRKMLERMIGQLGYEATCVDSGPRAVAAYSEPGAFDAVLLDVTMPGMGGPEVFRVLQELDPDVRVILMSGNPQAALKEISANPGVVRFLHKPFSARQLTDALTLATSESDG